MKRTRFFVQQRGEPSLFRTLLLPVLAFLVLLVLFFHGISQVRNTGGEEALRAVETAITRAAVQCYALEGQYPPDLAYLEAHYALEVDQERYIVHYDMFASNVMPQIAVFPRSS